MQQTLNKAWWLLSLEKCGGGAPGFQLIRIPKRKEEITKDIGPDSTGYNEGGL
jgi:hypothetical protein